MFILGDARNFKFGTRIDLGMSHLMHDKIPQKGAWWGPVAKFVNLSLESPLEDNSNTLTFDVVFVWPQQNEVLPFSAFIFETAFHILYVQWFFIRFCSVPCW